MAPNMSRPTATEIQGSALDRINGYTTSVLLTYKVRDTLSTRIGTPLGVNYYIMPLH